jgi:DNA polymerase I
VSILPQSAMLFLPPTQKVISAPSSVEKRLVRKKMRAGKTELVNGHFRSFTLPGLPAPTVLVYLLLTFMPSLVLLDANHLMHRAYWAIQRNLSTSSGEQTNAVFGVASMLLTMLAQEHPDAIIACFDEGKETLRHQEHAEYKAGRQETPDDFYTQIPRVHQCLDVFAIPVVSNPEYEADDLIGTLAKRGAMEGFDVTIVTGDRDLFQMATGPEQSRRADGNIRIAVPHKGYSEPEYLDAKSVELKLGITPKQVPDYKGLVGDASDNLKGVKGIGPKTAAKLLQHYGDLESLYAHIDEIKGNAKKKLQDDKESAFFCRKLARLFLDIPIDVDLHHVSEKKAVLSDIDRFFADLEFYTLRRRLKKLLTDDAFTKHYFIGDGMIDVPDDIERREEGSMAEEQLPLLD